MKIHSVLIFGSLAITGWAFCNVTLADDNVRLWRSTNGKSVKGELIEVRDGKAIIRPATKLIEAPLTKLTETDREIAIKLGKKIEKVQAERDEADLLLAKSKPLGKALIGNTQIVKGKSLVPYELKNISKIDYVLVYLSRLPSTRDVKSLNRLYKRLKARYDNFEFVALASTSKTEEANQFFLEGEIQFPVVPSSRLRGEGAQPLTQLYNRNVIPQIAVIDSEGRIVSDSYRAPDPNEKPKFAKEGEWAGPKQAMEAPQEEILKLLRATKGEGEDEE